MTTTETTLGQEIDLPAAATLDPPHASWLPLTAGDADLGRDMAAPEHEWPGSLFIFLTKATSVFMGFGAVCGVLGLVYALVMGQPEIMGLAALAAVGFSIGCVVQGTLAKHVEHFTRWGWWGAMAELSLATLAKVGTIVESGSFVGPVIGIVIDLLWMNYFWSRRADFDIDISL